jgi:hypothetical protein
MQNADTLLFLLIQADDCARQQQVLFITTVTFSASSAPVTPHLHTGVM